MNQEIEQQPQKLSRVDRIEIEQQKLRIAFCLLLNELRQIPEIPASAFDLVEMILEYKEKK